MKKLKFILCLTNNDNDYQIEQAATAETAAKRLGVELQVIDAENDSVTQSQQASEDYPVAQRLASRRNHF